MASHNTSFVDIKTKWNNNTEYALGIHKKVIHFLGYWANDKFDNSSKTRAGIINIAQIGMVIVFIKNFIAYKNCGTGEDLVDVLSFISTSLLAILKNILPWFKKNLYNDILNFLINDWSYINNINIKSRDIMFKYAKIGRAVLIIQLLAAYFTFIPLIVRSMNQLNNGYNNDTITTKNFPFVPHCWISATMSWNFYVGFYIIFCIELFILATSFVGGDVFLFTIAIHVCGQFEILYNTMENINYNKTYQQQHFFMKNFVIRHNQLLIMLKNIEGIGNRIIFFEVLGNTFLICITGFILLQSFNLSKGQMEFSLIARMFVLFTQLFLYSYIGENLTNRAKNLQSVIYNSNWHDLSPKIIKDMTFIISRSQYEFHLTAGKTRNMNMSNFKDIVKSIFSYLSILRLMFEK